MQQLLKACNFLWWKSFHSTQAVEQGRLLVQEAIAGVEAYLPCTELDVKLHDVLHLVDKVLLTGPLHTTSMFPYEWFNHLVVMMAKSKLHPEVSIMHSFAVYEMAKLIAAEKDAARQRQDGSADQQPHASGRAHSNVLDHASEDEDMLCYRPPGTSPSETEEIITSTEGSASRLIYLSKEELYHLHLLYMKQSEDYADLFNDFLESVYEAASEQGRREHCGVERTRHGFKYTKESFTSKLLNEWQRYKPVDLDAWATADRLHATAICENPVKLEMVALRHTKVTVNNVEFRPASNCSNSNPYFCWFLAVHGGSEDNANPYYAGKILEIIEHQPPWESRPTATGNNSANIDGMHIAKVEWHAGSLRHGQHVLDSVLAAPVVSRDVFTDLLNGPLWNCAAIAPVRFTVVPHYSNSNQLILLHRDPRSIWRANIPVDTGTLLQGCLAGPRGTTRRR